MTSISARSIAARSSRAAASYWLTESLRCLTIFSMTASTWASSSSMRSSTSRCLMAALTRRITPRLALSPPFMAAFMSSVRRCLRLIWNSPVASTQEAGDARACRLQGNDHDRGAGRRQAGSVHALALGNVARGATRLALHRRGGLALALLRRLLVILALAGLGQDAGLLAGALEAAEGKLEGLVFADFDAGHWESLGSGCAGFPPASRV